MSTDNPAQLVNSVLTGVNWKIASDAYLDSFVENYPLPHLALITQGQFLNAGAPDIANPQLKPYILVLSKQKVLKVIARAIKIRPDGRPIALLPPKFSIPEHFDGLFEILSEEGLTAAPLESVQELVNKWPDMCLVRASCKAYLPDNDGELRSLNRSRILENGNIMTLVGQFNFKKTQLLRCYDETGCSVYLKLSQKSRFSPIAKQNTNSISGVHYLKNLLETKRLPLTVRLISGHLFPGENNSGSCILRLQNTISESTVSCYLLKKQPEALNIPLNAFLRVAPIDDYGLLSARDDFIRLCYLCETIFAIIRKSVSLVTDEQLNAISRAERSSGPRSEVSRSSEEMSDLFKSSSDASGDDEIEQLYDYVRGLVPLPTTAITYPEYKPPPPPLDTLPSRRSESSSDRRRQRLSKSTERLNRSAGGDQTRRRPVSMAFIEPGFSLSPIASNPMSMHVAYGPPMLPFVPPHGHGPHVYLSPQHALFAPPSRFPRYPLSPF